MRPNFSIILVLIAAVFLRIYFVLRDSVPFAYDMGRDLLWVKDISFYHIPTLIGPAASIWGVYFGPLWFYFLSIPLLITGGHPLSAVFLTASTIILTGALAYFLFFKYLGKHLSVILAIIILFSATLINIATFAFHANLLPLLTLLTIYFSFLAIVENPIYISLSFFFVSLMFHADPAPAIVFTAIPLLIFIYFKLFTSKHVFKVLILSATLYILPFIPQIIFELRNDFIQTRSLIAYFHGDNPSLSGQLPIFERIGNRFDIFWNVLKDDFAGGNLYGAFFLLLLTVFSIMLLRSEKNKKIIIINKIAILSFALVFLIFTFIVTVEVKGWYLYGLTILFAFPVTYSVYSLGKRYKLFPYFFLITYVFLNTLPFFRQERVNSLKKDPSMLSNQMEVISLIYKDAQNIPFSVYTFTPAIYDYHYQYLFWWQGFIKNKGLPQEFAYLPDKPQYVRNKNQYHSQREKENIIYLIIEDSKENEFYTKEGWLTNFSDYQTLWEKDINDAILVQKRIKEI